MDKYDDNYSDSDNVQYYNPSVELRSTATRNTRASPLEKLDDTRKKPTWRQVRTILISSTGFFTDAYDIFIINLVTPMLGYIYYKNNDDKMPSDIQGPFKGMVSFGQLVGQLLFGFLGDALGRKAIYGIELIFIIISTINCATSASAVEGVGAVGFLGFWRFFLGMGIGGDYPLSSSVAAEWSSAGRRGQMVALIFSMQGFGQVAAALVTIIILACFRGAVEANVDNLDYVWRICIGLGAVPAVLTVYGRLTMPESPRYAVKVQNDEKRAIEALEATASWRKKKTKKKGQDDVDNATDVEQEAGATESLRRRTSILSRVIDEDDEDQLAKLKTGDSVEYPPAHPKSQKVIRKENLRDFVQHFRKWKNLKVLLGTSLSWFFMDIAFYGTNLNQALILSSMGFAPENLAPWDTLFMQALGNLILSVLGALPGYIVSVLLIEKIGRKPIQFLGFILVGVIFIILGAAWNPIHSASVALFIVLFAIAQFFFNFGANTTTFVFPAEVFPTRHRAKAHGISAASGKLGAIIATFAFNSLADVGGKPGERKFLPEVLIIFGALMLLCIIFTTWMPEPKGRSLDYFEAMDDDSRSSTEETRVEEPHRIDFANVNNNQL